MTDLAADRKMVPRAELRVGLVATWLGLGAATVVTAVLVVGWHRAFWIWMGSAFLLGLVLLPDLRRLHKGSKVSAIADWDGADATESPDPVSSSSAL